MQCPVNLPRSSNTPYLSLIDTNSLESSYPPPLNSDLTSQKEDELSECFAQISLKIPVRKSKKYADLIQEDLPTLEQISKTQDSSSARQKIEVLYRLKDNPYLSITKISQLMGINRVTVQRWLKVYQENGITGLLTQKKRPGRPRKLDGTIREILAEKLTERGGEFNSYKEIQQWLKDNYHVTLDYKTLYHLVRYDMKIHLTLSSQIVLANLDV